MAGVIEAYLAEVTDLLGHDPALAERLAEELADHFAEVLSEAPSEDEQREAVARMGPARDIAASLLADRADSTAERTGAVLVTALVATFIAMRLRSLWLPPLDTDGALAGALVPFVDRWAFVVAMLACAGWLIGRVRRPNARRGRWAAVALAGLCASVAAGILRIWLAAGWAEAPVLVVAATAGECLVVGLLMAQALALRRSLQRAARLAGL
jgi:hypothetical protein